ncbi:MAG TPA: flagellar hook-basal body protein [Symbiobacteriaceae bacterium]|nr:flagellar hook-basal body protein [Symbiobacteriaceae bacterium]
MLRGIGASRSGMVWEQTRSDVIANNVANINTDGFKRSVAVGREFGPMLLRRIGDQQPSGPRVGEVGSGAEVDEVAKDQTGGSLIKSENPLDAALIGPGEFTIQGPAGPAYTRDGRFKRAADGTLVTAKGQPVLVSGAPVGAGAGTLEIAEGGVVMVDGQPAGQLEVRNATPETEIRGGWLEGANVDLSQEMTDLITALRSFQVNQRALQMQDATLGKAVNDLANL